ncbi:unnamed protein product [Urochloa humidicola]
MEMVNEELQSRTHNSESLCILSRLQVHAMHDDIPIFQKFSHDEANSDDDKLINVIYKGEAYPPDAN